MGPAVPALITELRRCAGFEDLSGAVAAAEKAAKLDPEGARAAFIAILAELEHVDLEEDAGDVADELWRTRKAVARGLEVCDAVVDGAAGSA